MNQPFAQTFTSFFRQDKHITQPGESGAVGYDAGKANLFIFVVDPKAQRVFKRSLNHFDGAPSRPVRMVGEIIMNDIQLQQGRVGADLIFTALVFDALRAGVLERRWLGLGAAALDLYADRLGEAYPVGLFHPDAHCLDQWDVQTEVGDIGCEGLNGMARVFFDQLDDLLGNPALVDRIFDVVTLAAAARIGIEGQVDQKSLRVDALFGWNAYMTTGQKIRDDDFI